MNVRFLAVLSIVSIFGTCSGLMAHQKSSSSSSSSSSCPHGCRGPRGPQGYPGPRGYPGECNTSFLSVYTVNAQDAIQNGDALIFDEFSIPVQGPDLSYDSATGTVTFNTAGFYDVTYGVQVDLSEEQNASFAATLIPGGVVLASDLIFTDPYSDILNSISFIVQASAGQTMQIVSVTDSECGPVSTDTQNACSTASPVVAYLVVKKLP